MAQRQSYSEAEPEPPAFLGYSLCFLLKLVQGRVEGRSPRRSLGTGGVNLDIKSIKKKKKQKGSKFLLINISSNKARGKEGGENQ